MRNYSKPPYYIHEGACALNAVIKALKDESIILLDLSGNVDVATVAIKANEVASYLKIKKTANYDIGWTVFAVQLLIDKILLDGIISERELEISIDEELKNFKEIHNY